MNAVSTLERVGFVLNKYQDGDASFVDLLSRVKVALETSEMARVPAVEIRPYEGQPRDYFNLVKIQRLSDSIDVTAQIQAGMIRRLPSDAVVAGVKYEIVDGERRWRAIMLIPAERRPLYKSEIIEADDEVVQFLIAGMANFNREGHQPLEVAETIHRYCEFGIPMQAVADLLGISVPWAYNIKGLRTLAEPVKDLLRPRDDDDDEKKPKRPPLPVVAAMQLSKLPDPNLQIALARKVVRGEISLAHLRKEVVSVAAIAGIQVQQHIRSPLKRWERRETKMRPLLKSAEGISELLNDEAVMRIAHAHPVEKGKLRRDLQRARTLIEVAEKKLA